MDIQKPQELLNKLLSWWIRKHLFIHELPVVDTNVGTSFCPIENKNVVVFQGAYNIEGMKVRSVSMNVKSVNVSEVTSNFPSVTVGHLNMRMKPVGVNCVGVRFSCNVYGGVEFMKRLPIKRYNVVSRLCDMEYLILRWKVANLLKVPVENLIIRAVFCRVPVGWLKSVVWDNNRDILLIRLFSERRRQEMYATMVFYELNGKSGRLFLG